MPDIDRARKPLNRFWLYAPFAAAILIIAGWSAAWIGIRATVASRLDTAFAQLRAEGWTADWKTRAIDGYPFQIKVRLEAPAIAEPSGWGLAAPRVEAEADAYDLGHWVLAAPAGVTLTRPQRGAAAITGQLLRASVVVENGQPPRILAEGKALAMTPLAGATPLPITAADHLQFGLRPAAGDQGQFYAQIDGATARPGGALAVMTPGRPLTIAARGWLLKASALTGRDWPTAVRAWTAAGGAINLDRGELSAGPLGATAGQGQLKVGVDGRLQGGLPIMLRGGVQILKALSDARTIDPTAADTASSVVQALAPASAPARIDLGFQSGATTLGPVAVAPAPKVY